MSRRARGLLIALIVIVVGVAIGLTVFFIIRAVNRGNPLEAGHAHHISHLCSRTFGRGLETRDTSTASFNNDFTMFTVNFAGGENMTMMVTSSISNRSRFRADLVSIVNGQVMHFRLTGSSDGISIFHNLRYDVRTEIRDGETYYHYYYEETLVMAFTTAPPQWLGGGNAT